MGDEEPAEKGSTTAWFLRKFFTTPASYLGIAAALAAGNAALGADIPLEGAIGGGVMIGVVVGMVSFAIMHGIRASHQHALNSKKTTALDPGEQRILESLRESGQADDADLLEKLLGDRDAIQRRCGNSEENADAVHTLELASAIVTESCRQAEELQDLVRRVEDPLLTSPEGAEKSIEEIRSGLRRAYQAVADARSRLRRGETLAEADFLSSRGKQAVSDLTSLSSQLEEETAISKRVEERLRPDYQKGIVFDDDGGETTEDRSRELE